MSTWCYDVATQTIAGAISGAVVGAVLLYSQHRMERRLERERVQRDARRELLNAAFGMYQAVSWTFGGTGDQARVAAGWENANTAAAEWAAIETGRRLPPDVMKVSRAVRQALAEDLVAIVAMARIPGPPSEEHRLRWLAFGHKRAFEPLDPLIEACEREP